MIYVAGANNARGSVDNEVISQDPISGKCWSKIWIQYFLRNSDETNHFCAAQEADAGVGKEPDGSTRGADVESDAQRRRRHRPADAADAAAVTAVAAAVTAVAVAAAQNPRPSITLQTAQSTLSLSLSIFFHTTRQMNMVRCTECEPFHVIARSLRLTAFCCAPP